MVAVVPSPPLSARPCPGVGFLAPSCQVACPTRATARVALLAWRTGAFLPSRRPRAPHPPGGWCRVVLWLCGCGVVVVCVGVVGCAVVLWCVVWVCWWCCAVVCVWLWCCVVWLWVVVFLVVLLCCAAVSVW